MSNAISQINNWCQKNNKPVPVYTFSSYDLQWKCSFSVEFMSAKESDWFPSKNEAKLDISNKVWKQMQVENKIVLKPKQHTIILLDGDQRVDCWRWLSSPNLTWENMTVNVFVGPTSHRESAGTLFVSKSMSPDSADALLLMTLGKLLATNQDTTFLIVSADHILVQAALDTDHVEYVANLKELKEYFNVEQN